MSDHAFLAVDLRAEERHSLAAALTDANPGRRLPGKQTPPENWHITTRFLGECTELQAERLMHRLSEVVEGIDGRVWCTELDAFPKRSKASVLYVTVEDPDGGLERLVMWSEEAAQSAGFEPEERPYVPHLTLSRVRPPVDVRHTFESWDDFRVGIGLRAITLFRTRRARNGFRYEAIDQLPLS